MTTPEWKPFGSAENVKRRPLAGRAKLERRVDKLGEKAAKALTRHQRAYNVLVDYCYDHGLIPPAWGGTFRPTPRQLVNQMNCERVVAAEERLAKARRDRDRAAAHAGASAGAEFGVKMATHEPKAKLPVGDFGVPGIGQPVDPSPSQAADRASEGEAPASDGTTTGAGHQYVRTTFIRDDERSVVLTRHGWDRIYLDAHGDMGPAHLSRRELFEFAELVAHILDHRLVSNDIPPF
ncbi:hypothetical protein A3N99_02630 [Mycobacteroides abscessus]|uniref:hypothetical protein n=1 Tax=Mycobacteroides abscessus TaxID=36809 RepID=UPI00078BFCE7|nr:hypothetical protein [Mycobacteroides abscessus]AMU39208.1 hypothetical protein A3N99_02630 [Mycobacteroides abscessus]